LNLSLLITEGSYFAGFVLTRLADQQAPFLPTARLNQYGQPFELSHYSGFFGINGKTLAVFAIIYTNRLRLTWADSNQDVNPTDRPFLAHTVWLQSILFPASGPSHMLFRYKLLHKSPLRLL